MDTLMVWKRLAPFENGHFFGICNFWDLLWGEKPLKEKGMKINKHRIAMFFSCWAQQVHKSWCCLCIQVRFRTAEHRKIEPPQDVMRTWVVGIVDLAFKQTWLAGKIGGFFQLNSPTKKQCQTTSLAASAKTRAAWTNHEIRGKIQGKSVFLDGFCHAFSHGRNCEDNWIADFHWERPVEVFFGYIPIKKKTSTIPNIESTKTLDMYLSSICSAKKKHRGP